MPMFAGLFFRQEVDKGKLCVTRYIGSSKSIAIRINVAQVMQLLTGLGVTLKCFICEREIPGGHSMYLSKLQVAGHAI